MIVVILLLGSFIIVQLGAVFGFVGLGSAEHIYGTAVFFILMSLAVLVRSSKETAAILAEKETAGKNGRGG
jgi:hypothetical protein